MTEFPFKVASLIPTLLPEGEGLFPFLSLRDKGTLEVEQRD